MAASMNSSGIGLDCICRVSKDRLSTCSVNESCVASCESSLIHTDGATFHLVLRSSRQTQASETYWIVVTSTKPSLTLGRAVVQGDSLGGTISRDASPVTGCATSGFRGISSQECLQGAILAPFFKKCDGQTTTTTKLCLEKWTSTWPLCHPKLGVDGKMYCCSVAQWYPTLWDPMDCRNIQVFNNEQEKPGLQTPSGHFSSLNLKW